jgi:hypothetical protein
MIEHPICFVEHRHVLGIQPAGAAFAASVEQTKEGKRIHIVRAPRPASKPFIVQGGTCGYESLPFHVTQADGEPEILFPLRLHPFSHGPV